jgi:hypothetical protein
MVNLLVLIQPHLYDHYKWDGGRAGIANDQSLSISGVLAGRFHLRRAIYLKRLSSQSHQTGPVQEIGILRLIYQSSCRERRTVLTGSIMDEETPSSTYMI